ncbi:ABC-type nitrate/sulfonate/bicarbonate transport system, ATPase component [Clostridium pasteurianum DSM 525 = ATCC 6013]|uniref:ABC-type nitrate/sulfonate/bicarbonate transport system, ATPase component n=1 Tax=Clostridium pasteurianum DSM 525 = ATCC 6013 TaxID=1262449 RepID=A0A0H3J4A5_CLOPA|nr:ABC transporter ATP-binding protein [Clostridium pasteurianum]AJA48309.1 ABC-type nitrate/sulfonate/bicarbonate transport system, ATPase component [Clostridium pasteurianum DSM 525 = ATCC 6013]AJA52297.1 ABC-type nitrate/sulfonate/bicarbonate transport system, ATPase component [Clostridium pasteurianum DSM 525 = ATCC 6013]AOZ75561.1 ABC transporter ATP-binding protein [Clostridium pasteurianum DSM 525 = ATCC 6013]AOZ79356.1 ABC transporter ATP-binding protein [Clostridium pasteurianum]ELP60
MSEIIENVHEEREDNDYKVTIKNIKKSYTVISDEGKTDEEFLALENFNLQIKKGEFITIVGPSGCGKSTFLDILAGLSKPTSGEIYIDGKLITGPDLDRGIILQGYALFPWLNVTQNIEFGLEIKGISKAKRKEISAKFINLVGLDKFKNRYPHELSGGMKQRVAIARALAYDPEVLLMDEPFAAVDAQTRESLQEELLIIWEKTNKTIVFITHSIEEAIFLADRVVVMSSNPGKIEEIIKISLRRPRNTSDVINSKEFSKIWNLLHNNKPNNKTNEKASLKVSL